MDPIGAHHFWGFSPAMDLQQVYRTVMGPGDAPTGAEADMSPLNILLLQPGDPRSILKTIAQRSRHSDRPLHFFLHERPCEVLARDLLLLSIALDWELPLRQRAATWLEVFGNALVQSKTAKYISNKRMAMMDLLCNGRGPVPLGSVVDFESLKFRDRDELEFIFKTWEADASAFDMPTLRDFRLRHNYGARYDYRTNLVDWDYQSVLKKSAGVVHWVQYRDWRNTGVAFEYGDVTYDCPNRTLASYVEGREKGRGSVARRGFWGDTIVSPFHAVGTAAYVPTDEEARGSIVAEELTSGRDREKGKARPVGNYAHNLFDVVSRLSGSEQWRHHSVEMATYNLLSWLAELESGRQYVLRTEHDIYSGLADAASRPSAGGGQGEGAKSVRDSAPSSAEGEGEGTPAPAPHAPVPSGEMSTEAHAAIAAAARAAAVGRARSIARAFRNVRITLLTGDFADVLARGRLGPTGGMHVVVTSGRSVHHMAHPAFPSILHPTGAVMVAETARNVPTLKSEQRDEFVRRVIAMAGRVGAVLVGSDRHVSADTYSVGTVLDLNKKAKAGAGEGVRGGDPLVQPISGLPPAHDPFAFVSNCNGTFPGLEVPAGGLCTVGEPDAGTPAPRVAVRTKRLGMVSYSHKPAALPIVARIRAAAASPSPPPSSLALHAVTSLRAHIAGVASMDVEQGDNPAPEGLVFAWLPGGVCQEVAAAFAHETPMEKGATGVGAGGGGGVAPLLGDAESPDTAAANVADVMSS